MSKFSAFMKANKKVKENEKFAPTASLLGSDGTPVRWEFRHISSKENEELRDANTIEVQVTGKRLLKATYNFLVTSSVTTTPIVL